MRSHGFWSGPAPIGHRPLVAGADLAGGPEPEAGKLRVGRVEALWASAATDSCTSSKANWPPQARPRGAGASGGRHRRTPAGRAGVDSVKGDRGPASAWLALDVRHVADTCRRPATENLCPAAALPRGLPTPNGGYAEWAVVRGRTSRTRFLRPFRPLRRRPACCAPASSATGPLRRAARAGRGAAWGCTGFGSSAHIAIPRVAPPLGLHGLL